MNAFYYRPAKLSDDQLREWAENPWGTLESSVALATFCILD